MTTDKTIKIEGMSCGHCVMSVKSELEAVSGLKIKEVKIGTATVEVLDPTITNEQIKQAVEESGYKVISVN